MRMNEKVRNIEKQHVEVCVSGLFAHLSSIFVNFYVFCRISINIFLKIYLNSSQLNAALHIIQWVNSAGATTVRYQGKALTDT